MREEEAELEAQYMVDREQVAAMYEGMLPRSCWEHVDRLYNMEMTYVSLPFIGGNSLNTLLNEFEILNGITGRQV